MKISKYPVMLLFLAVLNIHCSSGEIDRTGLVKVSERVYAFIAEGAGTAQGLGANSGFVLGDDAVLVIDSRYTPALAGQLLEAVRSVTDLPVKYLVNTHYHPDHTWGNSVFADLGAVIIARPETRQGIEKYAPVYLEYYRKEMPEKYELLVDVRITLPDSVITENTVIDLGGVEVELFYPGPAHTAGDLIVSIGSEKTLFTGGLACNGYHANMGDPGADFDNWIAALDDMEKRAPVRVVPGQGKVCGKGVFAVQKKYLLDLIEIGRSAIREEKIFSEYLPDVVIPDSEEYRQKNMIAFNIQAVYRRYMFSTVDPDFMLDTSDDFVIQDGGGNAGKGRIKWIRQNEDGYSELELLWKPANVAEVLVQDIYDDVGRHLGKNTGLHMAVLGSKKIMFGDSESNAVFGSWGRKIRSVVATGGIWTWSMMIREGKIYSVRMTTNAMGDEAMEEYNMEILEKAVSTLHFIR
ncbi:MAG: MBL fold metallo-hydrolase [Candidatus Krumholzibacteriota bacterium]|nr:MBL fold metallo-hydrolase [Candidatus Krumholzibacteriota bacterium]